MCQSDPRNQNYNRHDIYASRTTRLDATEARNNANVLIEQPTKTNITMELKVEQR